MNPAPNDLRKILTAIISRLAVQDEEKEGKGKKKAVP